MRFLASVVNPMQINDSLQLYLDNISVANDPVQQDALFYVL